jgi:hypothetical protein
MYPLVVDIKFQRADGLIVEPQITNGKPQPAYIPPSHGIPWTVWWTVQRAAAGTDGFVTALVPAQKLIDSAAGDRLRYKARKIHNSASYVIPDGPGTMGFNENGYSIQNSSTDDGKSGNVNFNLEYVPFNLGAAAWSGKRSDYFSDLSNGPVWIIRNGVNDLAQDGNTDFKLFGTDATYNGNGAVWWVVGLPPVPPVNGALMVDNGKFIGPSSSTTPDISFDTGGYTEKAEVWYAVVAAGTTPPAYTAYTWVDSVEPGSHAEQITVDSGLVSSGYDVYVVIYKDGKVSAPEIIRSSGHVTIQPIWGVELTGSITAPVIGAIPVTTPPSDTQYTGQSVTWSPVHSAFQPGTQYKATVTLNVTEGYTFTGLTGEEVLCDGAAVSIKSNTGTTLKVEIAFPATPAGSLATVTDTDLAAKLPGNYHTTPVTSITGTQYTGIAKWFTLTAPETYQEVISFGAGTYRLLVFLTAQPGYTFAGLENAFYFPAPNAQSDYMACPENTGNTITLWSDFIIP